MDHLEDGSLLIEGQLQATAQWCKIAALLLSFHGLLGVSVDFAGGKGQLGPLAVLIMMAVTGGALYGIGRQLEDYVDWTRSAIGGAAIVACLLAGAMYLLAQGSAPLNSAPSAGGWFWFLVFGGMITYGLVRNKRSGDEPRLGMIASGLLLLTLFAPLVGDLGFLYYLIHVGFLVFVVFLLTSEQGAIALGLTTLFVIADAARGRDDILFLAALAYFGVLADLFLIRSPTRAFF